MEGHTKEMWEKITGITDEDLNEKIVGDFGCGAGRFIEVVRMKNGKVIGLDMSNAVEAAGEFFKDDSKVLICQADILHPPIAEKNLDITFSIGVLHHTPDPKLGFQSMVKTLKHQGLIAISVYGRDGHYDSRAVHAYRKFFKLLWPYFGQYPPLIYSWFTTYLLAPFDAIPLVRGVIYIMFPHIRLPDFQWSYLDTFDSITPSYQSGHEYGEVLQWFKNCNLSEIQKSDWPGVAMRGKKI